MPVQKSLVVLAPFLVVGLVALAGGCTLVVVDDLQRSPCAEVGDCAAGSTCVDGECAPVEPAPGPPPPGAPVGPEGALVEGPDGVTVDIPPAATDVVLRVTIERRSATTVPVGVLEQSRFYAVVPTAILVEPAIVALPLLDTVAGGTGSCAGCTLWLAPANEDEPWTPLPRAPAPAGFIGGELSVLGAVVVAGEAAP